MNNPLTMVDRNGQWPFYIHNEIINEAFPGMSASDRTILKDVSSEMDTHQESYNSWMHAMSDGTLPNRAEAMLVSMQMDDREIGLDEAEARVDQAQWLAQGHSGPSPLALQKFGNVLHIITDRLSPAHRGYQPWYGQSKASPSAWLHFLRESNPWNPAVNTSVEAARAAFRDTFGPLLTLQMLAQQPDNSSVHTIQGEGRPCGGSTGVPCGGQQ